MMKHKQQRKIHSSGESGFTIIESLVALIVTAILLAAISPVIILSTATRVQSRRIELATQAAKTYIDGIKTGAITDPTTIIKLDLVSATKPRTSNANLISITNMPVPANANNLYCFNKDGSLSNPTCTSDLYYIQAAQIQVDQSIQPKDGYRLGIRVYRADVDFNKTITASTSDTKDATKDTKTTQSTFTGGFGSRQAPLIEMTTDIGNSSTSFQALCQRFGVLSNGGKDCS